MMRDGVLDDALARFAATGPEFGGGLSNHGPMAAEALVALGRADAVERWTDGYITNQLGHPESRNPIDPADWREPLGDIARAGDWIAFFDRELRERPWRDVLETWTARLAPGIMAGATHGIIRTAHAVRTLGSGETPGRLHELAEGLAYWAARYQTLPGAPIATGSLSAADALPLVPLVPDNMRKMGGLIFRAVQQVEHIDFAPAIDLIAADGDSVDNAISDITRTFAGQYLANAGPAWIAFVHTVTAPAALRTLAPHLSDGTRSLALRYTWQSCAAIYSALGRPATSADAKPTPPDAVADGDPADVADLIEQAIASRDEHAIKFTEACLREHRLAPDRTYIAAIRDAVKRPRR
jgi:hypothetical protein